MGLTAEVEREKPKLVHGVSWEEYEAINGEDSPGTKYTYDDGTLEIMPPPSFGHEDRTHSLGDLLVQYLLHAGVPYEHVGSTTLKRQDALKGTDPDDGFYIRPDASLPLGLDDLDLTIHPPPNLVIEIDPSNSSVPREPILAAVGVAEVWRWSFRYETLSIRAQADGTTYEDSPMSVLLPELPLKALVDHVLLRNHLRDSEVAARWIRFLRGM
jgi:Uma2 family endonuclease